MSQGPVHRTAFTTSRGTRLATVTAPPPPGAQRFQAEPAGTTGSSYRAGISPVSPGKRPRERRVLQGAAPAPELPPPPPGSVPATPPSLWVSPSHLPHLQACPAPASSDPAATCPPAPRTPRAWPALGWAGLTPLRLPAQAWCTRVWRRLQSWVQPAGPRTRGGPRDGWPSQLARPCTLSSRNLHPGPVPHSRNRPPRGTSSVPTFQIRERLRGRQPRPDSGLTPCPERMLPPSVFQHPVLPHPVAGPVQSTLLWAPGTQTVNPA